MLIGLIPVGAVIGRDDRMFFLQGRVGILRFPIGKRGDGRAMKKAKSFFKRLKTDPVLRIFLKNAYTILCQMLPFVWIEALKLHITVGGRDPANTAMLYGAAGGVLEALHSRIGVYAAKEDLHAEADFTRVDTDISFRISLFLRLYTALWCTLRIVWSSRRECKQLSKGSIGR